MQGRNKCFHRKSGEKWSDTRSLVQAGGEAEEKALVYGLKDCVGNLGPEGKPVLHEEKGAKKVVKLGWS